MIQKTIKGKNIALRDIEETDAEFILQLRLNEKRNKYIHKVDNNLQKQVEYIKAYKRRSEDYYFIIELLNGDRLGALRIYEIEDNNFTWGSWILKEDAPLFTALESALLVYEYAFRVLGLLNCHFKVHVHNTKVRSFHEKMGALLQIEREDEAFYIYNREIYNNIKSRYKKWLP